MNLPNKNKITVIFVKYFRFILIGIVILVLFFSGYFILYPKYTEIGDEGGLDYKSKVELLKSRENELKQLQALEKEFTKVSSVEIRKLEKILPSSEDVPDLFVQMENLARESGLSVTRIGITDGRTADTGNSRSTQQNSSDNATTASGKISNISSVDVSLSVIGDGTYSGLKVFLDNIENNMRIVNVDSLSYTPSEAESASYSINLTTYYIEKD